MNLAQIAETFIRAAEIDRNSREHVGPAALRAQQLPYVHDQADKNGWGKAKEQRILDRRGRLIQGDWLDENEDPLAAERRAFWERVGRQPTSAELAAIEIIFDLLRAADDEAERRALLAWSRAKAGGKSFRRWCFQTEGIHEATGHRRKDRALAKIERRLSGSMAQHGESAPVGVLMRGHEIGDVSDTIAEDAGEREGLNSWMSDSAVSVFRSDGPFDFSWAEKRNERRRRREAKKRKATKAVA